MLALAERMWVALVGYCSTLALRFICLTWRVHIHGLDELDRRLDAGECLIAVFWHGKYYPLLPLLRNRRVCVFTSVSSRGSVISSILRQFGYQVVQLPDHGREQSLDLMRKALQNGASAAIAVDGPLGPYHVVHRGAVQLASELGHSIIPISVASSRHRVLSARWDRFEMPRLFSKIVVLVGDPIRVPAGLVLAELDVLISKVQLALEVGDLAAFSRLNE